MNIQEYIGEVMKSIRNPYIVSVDFDLNLDARAKVVDGGSSNIHFTFLVPETQKMSRVELDELLKN